MLDSFIFLIYCNLLSGILAAKMTLQSLIRNSIFSECVSNVDDELAEMFLVDKQPSDEQLYVCNRMHLFEYSHLSGR